MSAGSRAPARASPASAGGAVPSSSPSERPAPSPGDEARATRSARFVSMASEPHGKPIYGVAFCPGPAPLSHYFATVGGNQVTVYTNESPQGFEVIQAYVDEDAEVLYCCAWTVDPVTSEPLLATAGERGLIKVFNLARCDLAVVLEGHGNSVNDLKVHPIDPFLLLSASKDESLRLWNLTTQACVAIFAGDLGHRDEVLSSAFHSLGHLVVSAGMDNTVKVWDVDSADMREAIVDSYRHDPTGCVPFRTRYVQFPAFTTSAVHIDYVDSVLFVGNFIASKSTGNCVILWAPDTSVDPSRDPSFLARVTEGSVAQTLRRGRADKGDGALVDKRSSSSSSSNSSAGGGGGGAGSKSEAWDEVVNLVDDSPPVRRSTRARRSGRAGSSGTGQGRAGGRRRGSKERRKGKKGRSSAVDDDEDEEEEDEEEDDEEEDDDDDDDDDDEDEDEDEDDEDDEDGEKDEEGAERGRGADESEEGDEAAKEGGRGRGRGRGRSEAAEVEREEEARAKRGAEDAQGVRAEATRATVDSGARKEGRGGVGIGVRAGSQAKDTRPRSGKGLAASEGVVPAGAPLGPRSVSQGEEMDASAGLVDEDGAVTVIQEFTLPDANLWYLRMSLDASCRYLALGNRSGSVYVWRVDTITASGTTSGRVALLSHPRCSAPVRQTAFSPDGRSVVFTCDDASVWRFDWTSG